MEKDVIMFFTTKKKKGHEDFPSWFLVNFVVKMIVFGQVLSVEFIRRPFDRLGNKRKQELRNNDR